MEISQLSVLVGLKDRICARFVKGDVPVGERLVTFR